jgi:chemotaxis protein methyltransferase CheR
MRERPALIRSAPCGDAPLAYAFTERDFAWIRGLIHRKAGIALAPGKIDLAYGRLVRRVRARGVDSFADYLRLIERGDERELQCFVNALTTNMTAFFREPHHFRILADELARRGKREPVSIWSCASSSGEEPYSIAMAALEVLKPPAPLQIFATDIDTDVLAKGVAGIYPLERVQKVGAERLKRFFLKGEGKRRGFAKVKDEVRRVVNFRQFNLLDEEWRLPGRFDYIFCRNVMIYFDRETQLALLERLAAAMKPGGLLFVGHSESFHGVQDFFRICGNTVYALDRR